MSDERFFSQVKSTMDHYAPAVADNVYLGMRRKFWWSKFTTLSVTRFNMWYLLLMLAGGGALAMNYYGSSASAEMPVKNSSPEFVVMPVSNQISAESTTCANAVNYSSCCSKKNENSAACKTAVAAAKSCEAGSSANLKNKVAPKDELITASAESANKSVISGADEVGVEAVVVEVKNSVEKPRGKKGLITPVIVDQNEKKE